ncbi:MAG: NTP transferase domain-containing protein [Bacteroidota bacterium]
MKTNIYIVSKAIQTGKTTDLLQWCKQQSNVAGILTPDVDGSRKLYDIKQKQTFDFETKEVLPANEITPIGRFHFLTEGFKQAQQIIHAGVGSEYLVIDEIGRLELNEGKGLEPSLGQVIKQYVSKAVSGNLVLVIRDYLLEACMEKYSLHDAQIIQSPEEINKQNELIGLVLCGGKSTRMHTDKAFINYHEKEQVYYLADKMKLLSSSVFIACNATQKEKISEHYKTICDSATFENTGPIAAILTALSHYPTHSFLVLACDYPLLTLTDILKLKSAFLSTQKSVSFYNEETGFREPLLAIYHAHDLQKLLSFYESENTSLQHFLNEIDAVKVKPTDLKAIKSIDTKLDFDEIKSLITHN